MRARPPPQIACRSKRQSSSSSSNRLPGSPSRKAAACVRPSGKEMWSATPSQGARPRRSHSINNFAGSSRTWRVLPWDVRNNRVRKNWRVSVLLTTYYVQPLAINATPIADAQICLDLFYLVPSRACTLSVCGAPRAKETSFQDQQIRRGTSSHETGGRLAWPGAEYRAYSGCLHWPVTRCVAARQSWMSAPGCRVSRVNTPQVTPNQSGKRRNPMALERHQSGSPWCLWKLNGTSC